MWRPERLGPGAVAAGPRRAWRPGRLVRRPMAAVLLVLVVAAGCGGSADESDAGAADSKDTRHSTSPFELPDQQVPPDERRAPIAAVEWDDEAVEATVEWRREVPLAGDGPDAITSLGAGPGLVAFSSFGLTPNTLVAFDPEGEPAWATTNRVAEIVVGAETTVALQAGSHDLPRIFAFDTVTGASQWITKARDGTADIDVVGDTIYVTSDGLEALDIADGSSRWHNPLVDKSYPLASDGEVVVAAGAVRSLNSAWSSAPRDSTLLFGLDADDGELRWAIDAGSGAPESFVVVDGVVYVTFARGVVAALDARSGEAFWVETPILHSAMATAPTLGALHVIGEHEGTLVVASRDGTLAGLRIATGSPRWVAFGAVQFSGDSGVPAATMSGGAVLSAGPEQVSVVDVQTGQLLSRIPVQTEIAPVSGDGQVYVVDAVAKGDDGRPAARLTAWDVPDDALGIDDR